MVAGARRHETLEQNHLAKCVQKDGDFIYIYIYIYRALMEGARRYVQQIGT
jgi:hypothetical protein